MSKWEYPNLEEVDNIAFTVIRQYTHDLLFELHMAENQKLVEGKGETYWDNFCDRVEHLSTRVDEAVYHGFTDS